MNNLKSSILSELEDLKNMGRYRSPKNIARCEGKYIYTSDSGERLLDFASNNYLGLRDSPKLRYASIRAINKYGCGSGASRLISGECELFYELESKIAKLKKQEKAIIFNSGYDANLGVISTLFSSKDVIFSDKLNHASILDGINSSGAKLIRYKHNDIEDLSEKLSQHRNLYKNALVVTDTVFSMDGDIAQLKAIASLKNTFDFMLMVDEAHGTGIFGKTGAGVCEDADILDAVDINMGTFGKALGTSGAYIASTSYIVDYLFNKCRTLIFTTALPPISIAGALASLEVIAESNLGRESLLMKANNLRDSLKSIGISTLNSCSQIIPVLCTSSEEAVELSSYLKASGIYAPAVRYPTVPLKFPRIRLSLNTLLDDNDINILIESLKKYKSIKGVSI